MSERDLLKSLSEAAREDLRAARDEEPGWIARQRGETTPELEAREDDFARHMREALPPLDAARIDRFVTAAQRARGVEAEPPTMPAKAPAKVVDLATRRPATLGQSAGRRAIVVGGVLSLVAAAAAILLILRRPPPAELPLYAMNVLGRDREMRGGDAGPGSVTLSAGAWVRIELRPGTSTTTPVLARAWIVRATEQREVPVPALIAETGAVRLEGSREALFGDATGTWQLHVVVAPAGKVPISPHSAPPGGHVLRAEIDLPAGQ
jgi:hypothetical protein